MKRRRVLSAAPAAALVLGWPKWLKHAFAGEPGTKDPACVAGAGSAAAGVRRGWLQVVAAGYRRAQAAGKPLLVFVIPKENVVERWARGHAFGEILNHGDDEAMAVLSLAEVVAAPLFAVKALVPSVADDEPLMFLIETDGVPARTRAIALKLRDRGSVRWQDREKEERREDAEVDRAIDALGKVLRESLAPDAGTVARRARQQEARLTSAQALNLRGALVTHLPVVRELDPVAALVYEAAVAAPAGERERLMRALAGTAGARLRDRRVPGSRWANGSGCGIEIEWEPGEEEDGFMVGCGMGYVPEKSRRLLDFLTLDTDSERSR